MQIKRHVKGKPYEEKISASNSFVIVAEGNVTLESPLLPLDVFKEGAIDRDLELLT